MQNKKHIDYLDDKELQDLMNQVEANEMWKAPEYLESKIIRKIDYEKTQSELKKHESKNKKLFLYSMKISLAAAASFAILILSPMDRINQYYSAQTITEAKQQSQNEYMKKKEKAQKSSQRTSFTKKIDQATTSFCDGLTDRTNSLFNKEDK